MMNSRRLIQNILRPTPIALTRWFARHPRFHIHFTPTRSTWLNMVERFFRDLTQNRLRGAVFHDAEEPIMAIGEYIDKHNQSPKTFHLDR
jgi:transposase